MNRGLRCLVLACLLAASPVRAEVFTRVDAGTGMTILSNVAPRAAPSPERSAVLAPPVQQTAAPGAAAFPRVSGEQQRALDRGRRAILQAELEAEQQDYDKDAGSRAAADVLARHAANIEALKRELRGTR